MSGSRVLLEVAVSDPRDVAGAAEGGADRLHLVVPGPTCGLSPEPALVTIRMTADWIPSAPPPVLTTPSNVAILGPPVRVAASREVSWRILPYSPVSDKLLFRYNGQEVAKWLEAGDRQRYVTGRRVRSRWETILSPGETRMRSDFAEWIEIRYPSADLRIFGVHVNWLAWFLIVSTATALLLKKRFGVVI